MKDELIGILQGGSRSPLKLRFCGDFDNLATGSAASRPRRSRERPNPDTTQPPAGPVRAHHSTRSTVVRVRLAEQFSAVAGTLLVSADLIHTGDGDQHHDDDYEETDDDGAGLGEEGTRVLLVRGCRRHPGATVPPPAAIGAELWWRDGVPRHRPMAWDTVACRVADDVPSHV